jgi:hypothetical protein
VQAHTTGSSTIEDVGVKLNTSGDEPFAVLTLGHVQIFLYTEADADKLIKAGCAAKDMLHARNHEAAMTDPLAPLRDRLHFGEGLPVAEDGGDDGDTREPYCKVCLFTLDAKGDHLYPDGLIVGAHDPEPDWREPVGRKPTAAEARAISSADGWDPTACQECGSREGAVVDGWHTECKAYRDGVNKRDATTVGSVTDAMAQAYVNTGLPKPEVQS